ncbi:MAG: hypothetical protein P1U56_02975 [Saprospiraceae bacterium]|nr:hypothetical protein [Saprospiraceae bacterium]
MKKNVIWISGFVLLFLLNLAVEFFILPTIGLDNTPKNDIYFKIWWLAVGTWLIIGRILIDRYLIGEIGEIGEI